MKEHAVVLGKMMNTHKGHQALISYAKTKAKKVTVLLCVTPLDRVRGTAREAWLYDTFGESITVKYFNYLDAGLDGGEESDDGISKCWAEWVDEHMPTVDLIVGSEDYVTYMANHGSFEADIYDMERTITPCSSTAVNEGAYEFYIHAAKESMAKKVYILGAESSGKTTAAHLLAGHYNAELVLEQARNHLTADGSYSVYDLDIFALAQELEVRKTVRDGKSPLTIIDSSAVTTWVYSLMQFGFVVDTAYDLAHKERGTYIVMSPEVEWVNDGTRSMSDILDRQEFFDRTIGILQSMGKDYYIVKGTDYNTRLQGAKNVIDNL